MPVMSPRMLVVYEDEPADMGQIEYVLRHRRCTWVEYCRRHMTDVQFTPSEYAGLIVLGGGNIAHKREQSWIESAVEAGCPVLGICQGAQVLAVSQTGGGWVAGPRRKCGADRGLIPLRRPPKVEAESVLGWVKDGQQMYQCHSWVYKRPVGADNLLDSGNQEFPHEDAFRLGDRRSYGLQFHPEATSSQLANWLDGRVGRAECLEIAEVGWKILDAWVELALTTSR